MTSPSEQPVRHAAVIGAGFMGGGIAAELALRVETLERVTLWDAVDGAAPRAVERARDVAQILVEAGVLDPAVVDSRLRRLRAVATLEEAVDGAVYVAEVVPEDLALKQQVFQ